MVRSNFAACYLPVADYLGPGQPRVDPFLAAVGPGLAFPDRRNLLERVDEPAAGFKSLAAVWAAHGDDHADFAQVEMANSVDDGDIDDRPSLTSFLLDLGQLFHSHFGIGLIIERERLPIACQLADRTQKRTDRHRPGWTELARSAPRGRSGFQ